MARRLKLACPNEARHDQHTWEAMHYFHGESHLLVCLCEGVRSSIGDRPFFVRSVRGYLSVACGTCDRVLYLQDSTLDGPALATIVDEHYKEKH